MFLRQKFSDTALLLPATEGEQHRCLDLLLFPEEAIITLYLPLRLSASGSAPSL